MSSHYDGLNLKPLAFDFDAGEPVGLNGSVTLTGLDVLGIVQAAFDDLAPRDDQLLVAVKLAVLEEVAEGRLAEALRTAITGAGRRAA